RNLDRRVEALAPITDPDLQFRIDEVIDVLMADDMLAWKLFEDGTWARVPVVSGVDAHLVLQELARVRASAHL
ncbi:MAG: RNA degradosome polyphosphate kinase, partial [Acidimicrobiia bacterium]